VAEVRLTERARRDLAEIHEYSLQQYGPEAADAYVASFADAFDRLRAFPRVGVVLPAIRPPVRYLVHRRHRIMYDVVADDVLIRRILHTRMDPSQPLG
jgi:toxin ParE1/3/4